MDFLYMCSTMCKDLLIFFPFDLFVESNSGLESTSTALSRRNAKYKDFKNLPRHTVLLPSLKCCSIHSASRHSYQYTCNSEAKDSSEIENIVTTHDEIYKANMA